jgi:hypothetical protein
MKDFYIFYTNEVQDNEIYEIEYNDYVEIVTDFYKEMIDHVLLKNWKFVLPFNMGDVYVVKSKLNLRNLINRGLDWKVTIETGKRVYHLNEHSNGYKYFYHWDKTRSRLKKLYLYRFQLTRENKRRLAKLIKSGEYDYFEKR